MHLHVRNFEFWAQLVFVCVYFVFLFFPRLALGLNIYFSDDFYGGLLLQAALGLQALR